MIAIIPARGGSKGLPGKNIKDLLGKPMIAYTIIEALKSKHISDVIISTDDQEIYDIAIKYGACGHFLRPGSLSEDSSLAIDNYLYTIERLNSEFDYNIEDFVILQPTSPLRITDDIDKAIELFQYKDADSVVSYVAEDHPVSWHKYIGDDNRFIDIFENNLKNRQDNRVSYYPNGAIFIFKYSLIKDRKYYSDNSYAYIMPKDRSIDVDTIDDFNYIEFLMTTKYKDRYEKK